MSRILRIILEVFSSLGKSTSLPTSFLPSSSTTITSAKPTISSSPSSPSIPTLPSPSTTEALILARKQDAEMIRPISKDWTASQLRQMIDHGVKSRGQKNWSGVVEGKTGVECQPAWTESISRNLRKALHNRPKKSD